jgi:hypothetical protein
MTKIFGRKKMHLETNTENETKMVFRAMFLGIPVYSAETNSSVSVESTTADLTAMVSHEEFDA